MDGPRFRALVPATLMLPLLIKANEPPTQKADVVIQRSVSHFFLQLVQEIIVFWGLNAEVLLSDCLMSDLYWGWPGV